ncbi:MAG: hypothetical protein J5806_07555 [Lentisphaeria bacterium]|nr:hypothetical protein [Lentisphaeria bacterium]
MRILPVAVLLCCFLPVFAGTVDFVRPVRTGDRFECNVLSVQSVQYELLLPGSEAPVVKTVRAQVGFQGYLTVTRVNAVGNPTHLMLRADRFSGSVDGKPVKWDFPAGAWIDADLSSAAGVFNISGKPLPADLQNLFRILFPPASESTLAELTGRSRRLPVPGQGWAADLTSFRRELAARKIPIAPSSLIGTVVYFGPETIGRSNCLRFGLQIETKGLPDYDCRLKYTFSLAPSGPPVRLVRDATEVIFRILRSGQPFAAGTQVRQINKDHTERTLVPVQVIPPVKVKRAGDSLLR